MSATNYVPGAGLQPWATTMPNIIQAGSPISGHGSPEGVVPAPIGKLYTDLDSLDIYQKEVGGNLTGWVKRGVAGAGGGSGTGTGGTGAGYPLYAGTTQQRNNTTPATAYAVWMLTDSTPPYQLSIWANAQWN